MPRATGRKTTSATSGGNVEFKTVRQVFEENAMEYAYEVVLKRAFPNINDGLKFSQLALMLAMRDHDTKSEKFVKANEIIGTALGRYYPHGDYALYLTAINLAVQKNALIETSGKVKSKRSKKTAAPRYVGLRLTPLGKEMLSLINTDIVPKISNYDDSRQMPKYLASRIPYPLFSDNNSIGYGIGSLSLPFNAGEILEAMKILTANPVATTEELMDVIQGPDLSDKTKIYMSKQSLASLIEKGNGLVTAVCDVAVDRENNSIVVEEVPWRETSAQLYADITSKASKSTVRTNPNDCIDGIIKGSVGQFSTKDIRIKMLVEYGHDIDDVVAQLYSKTNLKKVYNIKYLFVTSDDKLELYSIRDILNYYISINRQAVEYSYRKRLERLRRERDEAEIIEIATREQNKEWFIHCFYQKNKRQLLGDRTLTEDLTSGQLTDDAWTKGLRDEQITTALEMNIAKKLSDRGEALQTLAEYEAKKAEIEALITPENVTREVIEYIDHIKGLVDTTRESQIFYANPNIKTMIKNKEIVGEIETTPERIDVYLTENNFIGCNLEDIPLNDRIKYSFSALTNEFLYLFSNNEEVKIEVGTIDRRFEHISKYIGNSDLKGAFILKEGFDYVFISNKGGVKKVNYTELEIQKNHAASYEFEPDEYVVKYFICNVYEETFIDILSRNGYMKRISSQDLSYRKRRSGFVGAINLAEDDFIVDAGEVAMDASTSKIITDSSIVVAEYLPIDLFKIAKGASVTKGECRFIVNGTLGISSDFIEEYDLHAYSVFDRVEETLTFSELSNISPDAETVQLLEENDINVLTDPDLSFYSKLQ